MHSKNEATCIHVSTFRHPVDFPTLLQDSCVPITIGDLVLRLVPQHLTFCGSDHNPLNFTDSSECPSMYVIHLRRPFVYVRRHARHLLTFPHCYMICVPIKIGDHML